jgi:hypothetical protein
MGLNICLETNNDLVVKKDLLCQDENKRKKLIGNINNNNLIMTQEINKEEDNLDLINNIQEKLDENFNKNINDEIQLKTNINNRIKDNEKINISDKISVNSIIPEQKLHSKNNNEIMFLGELEKIEENNIISYFATLNRLKINFYENKSQFISMKKPISSLNLNQILNADIMKDCENKLFLCINLIENEEKKLFQTKTKQLLFKWRCVLNYFIPLSQAN